MKKNEILKIMSRRDALKYLTLAPLSASVIATSTLEGSELKSSKIVIVGGGLGGISTAALLKKKLSNPDITIIESNPLSPSYQAGLSLVAAGIWNADEILYKRDDKIPRGVKLIKAKVTSFNPKKNTLLLDNKKEVTYNQLVIATDSKLNYDAIKGLKGTTKLGKDGLHSLYYNDGATATFIGIQELIKKAKKHTGHKKLQAVFTHPNTPIKGGISSKEIMYLVHSRLVEAGIREKVEISFYTNGTKLLGIEAFHKVILKQFKQKNFNLSYKHNLIEIDSINKTIIFDRQTTIQGPYDEKLKEYGIITKKEKLEVPYDFLHLTPPMMASDTLGLANSWIPVNKETLCHLKYDNVWALGDMISTPFGKTIASLHIQHKILVENLIASIQNKKILPAKYNGYTLYPLATDIGKVMLMEFDWDMKPTPTFPLNPTKERWIWWLLKVYAIKPIVMKGMLNGHA